MSGLESQDFTQGNERTSLEASASKRAVESPNNHTLTLWGMLTVLAMHKKTVLGLPLCAGVAAAVLSLLMPNIYTATARVLPPQQAQSSTFAMLSQLGGLAGLATPSLKNPNDLYVGMLKSRTVVDGLIRRVKLQETYGTPSMHDTRLTVAARTKFSVGKEGIISIDYEDRDARRAAEIANAYVDELFKLTQLLAVTEASQRRLFFEKQLKTAKENLAGAEVALKETQQSTGLIRIDEQGKAIIEGIARLRAQATAIEVQLSAMRSFATATNPDYLRTQRELAEVRAQLARAEKDNTSEGSIFLPTGRIPASGLEYVRRLRDVKYHETIFELLAKQFEVAKIDEAKDSSILQVLDEAIAPERKSKPHRALIVMLTVFTVGFGVVLWLFMREALTQAQQDPRQEERIQLFLRVLKAR